MVQVAGVDQEQGLTTEAEEEKEKEKANQSRNMRLMIYLSGTNKDSFG